ncbi:MAG TPA: hypothetical protein VEC18_09715, partial [Myxococcota bacterium]|nr:hypothetical protein [Myxococcota bacterium]
SISAAARSMGMAYRHAWELIDDLNQCFREPVLVATPGGHAGGGASLTPFGEALVRRFRAMEHAASRAIARDLAALERACAAQQPTSRPTTRRATRAKRAARRR